MDLLQGDMGTVDGNFSNLSEVYRNPSSHVGLHLPQTPIRFGGIAYQGAGFEEFVQVQLAASLSGSMVMGAETTQLAALIGSRICHDIISPIGAINNGLELMELGGHAPGPETALIQESCNSAQARIGFFRVAYGAAADAQSIGAREASDILAKLAASGGRQRYIWKVAHETPRSEVQLAFLGVQMMETALPTGGIVSIHHEGGRWRLQIEEGNPQVEGPLWEALASGKVPQDIRPEHVQFALLPRLLEGTGRRAQIVTEGSLTSLVI